ncbi:hypothetical protein JRO89_XS14G0150400 [Xanthoceras sorbifolium]|uniref:RNase H type-1 domain-containing protein n=1 Tax=Xanthoceras sorbifolium TaxID=99658 RepID=A0ABQ8H5F7_9ROSI|nr:hypothetical protein JRO89_XS14G0150400 [Xanthoceras sorbifolium]
MTSLHENGNIVEDFDSTEVYNPGNLTTQINTDAALDVGRNCTGLGVIIRDSAGMVLLVGVKRLAGALNPEMAEALAVLFGLSLSAEAGIHPISLDKLVLLMENLNVSISFDSRLANKVAHRLVKFAIYVDQQLMWLEDYPSWYLYNFTNLEELWLDDSSLHISLLHSIAAVTSLQTWSMGSCQVNTCTCCIPALFEFVLRLKTVH